jgi:sialic acid synthase SpsE
MTSPPVFVIAEAGSNWRMGTPARDLEMAYRLIGIAADAGADAIKFQTYRAKSVYAEGAGASDYLADAGEERSIHDIFLDLEMPYEMIALLAARATAAGIEFMSTPFSVADLAAVDPHVRRHKIASYEICHVRLIQAAAATGKPMVMSTGAAEPADIAFGLQTARDAGARDITVLQCTASYPAPPASLNLRAIPWLMQTFSVAAGLSDHSTHPVLAPSVAVAMGATVIEKHFTIDRRLPGPDHPFALEPDELAQMVKAIRLATVALGDGVKEVKPAEAELRAFAVRTIQATSPIRRGDELVEGRNLDVLRPGRRSPGLHPRHLEALAGRRAARDIDAGDGIAADAVDPPLDQEGG